MNTQIKIDETIEISMGFPKPIEGVICKMGRKVKTL